jgi:type I restriction enzyme, R subunit
MTDFKQIIGRGTRVREDYGKLYFNIVDYTGSATRLFADPDFDGEPTLMDEELIDENGNVLEQTVVEDESQGAEEDEAIEVVLLEFSEKEPADVRKFYFDGGSVQIAAQVVYELDSDGKQLRVVSYTDYARDKVRALYRTAEDLEKDWRQRAQRKTILDALAERGIDLHRLADVAGMPDADPLDLLCHLAFNRPPRTRRERVQRLARENEAFFDRYSPEAREILDELVDKYADYGLDQLRLPDVLKLPPLSTRGNPSEIARLFGGPQQLREAVEELEELIYA